MTLKNIGFLVTIVGMLFVVLTGCEDDEYSLPQPKNEFQNDCIKRTIGPNLVGNRIEFAYAMALPPDLGALASAQVEASIPGAANTRFDNLAYYTAGNGADVGIEVASPSSTEGNFTNVTFTRDTFATTLRYYYVIPEEARGQSVSFTFSAKDSNGKTVKYDMGPYEISNMDMALDRAVNGTAMYISVADMAVYDAAQAATMPDKIDVVYLYRSIGGKNFNHALVAPAADPVYLPGVTLPAGVDNNTKIIETLNLRDQHLARLQYGVYVDEVDFRNLNLSTASNFAINLKAESGAWVETEDGKYRAYIYVNSVNANGSAVISMKRLTMF
ncbi:DUF4466 family protein [Chryseosolibacter indicus]|uniref:DUF4466 family protein n=1 Tax=Chryseosolibacter indicus TaxID=2782351 RepID=A0ABS5VSG2_9BACT|nr:DUF4466 family protein [Chryseosolibacter indicus]MBT1703775.1 DUF4466 family protein [Chryseosolibacter indicus]